MQTVTEYYLMGVKEGRETLRKYGTELITIEERISNLKSTLQGFNNSSPVGQMLLGELDFWKNQLKKTKAN